MNKKRKDKKCHLPQHTPQQHEQKEERSPAPRAAPAPGKSTAPPRSPVVLFLTCLLFGGGHGGMGRHLDKPRRPPSTHRPAFPKRRGAINFEQKKYLVPAREVDEAVAHVGEVHQDLQHAVGGGWFVWFVWVLGGGGVVELNGCVASRPRPRPESTPTNTAIAHKQTKDAPVLVAAVAEVHQPAPDLPAAVAFRLSLRVMGVGGFVRPKEDGW